MRLAWLRHGPEHRRLVWSCHHALLDGWSMPVVLGEVFEIVGAAGKLSAVDPTPESVEFAPRVIDLGPARDLDLGTIDLAAGGLDAAELAALRAFHFDVVTVDLAGEGPAWGEGALDVASVAFILWPAGDDTTPAVQAGIRWALRQVESQPSQCQSDAIRQHMCSISQQR